MKKTLYADVHDKTDCNLRRKHFIRIILFEEEIFQSKRGRIKINATLDDENILTLAQNKCSDKLEIFIFMETPDEFRLSHTI